MTNSRKDVETALMESRNPRLYEVTTVVWLQELSIRYGTQVSLGTVPGEVWDRFEASGFHWVWLMGVWKRSPLGRTIARRTASLFPAYEKALPDWTEADVIGSAYSIQSYEPDPLVGSWQDLRQAQSELNRRNIGLMLDFIGNHTGPDHPWVTEHPEYFVQGGTAAYERDRSAFLVVEKDGGRFFLAQGKDPFFPPWQDTVQLNCFHPSARRALLQELQKISAYCDGLRCDMAMLSLNRVFAETWRDHLKLPVPSAEFWSLAIAEVKGLTWMAEAYWDTGPELQRLGFQFTYDKNFYDRLRSGRPYDLFLHLRAQPRDQEKLVRFLENHDEPRSAAVFSSERLQALALLHATAPGMRLYYQGQLEGFKTRVPVQLIRSREHAPDPAVQSIYRHILGITVDACFRSGNWQLKGVWSAGDASFHTLLAYRWQFQDQLRLVVVNLGDSWAQGRVGLQGDVEEGRTYLLVDDLNQKQYVREGTEMSHDGLHVILEPFRSHLFSFERR